MRIRLAALFSGKTLGQGSAVALLPVAVLVAACASAAVALAQDDVGKLTQALKSGDEKARVEAIDKLGHQGRAGKAAVAELAALLADKSPAVRAHAAHALQLLGPVAHEATDALINASKDADPHVRRVAVVALGKIHGEPSQVLGEVIASLAKSLEDPEPAVRVAALEALTELGEAAVPALTDALDKPETCYWAALALGEMGPHAKSAVDDLARVLNDKRPEVRRELLLALARIGADSAEVVPNITAQMADPDPTVRHAAAFALGRIGPPAAPAAGTLRLAMKSPDEMLKTISTWAFARVDPTNVAAQKEAIAALIAILKNKTIKEPQVQVAALKEFVDLGPPPDALVPLLSQMLADGKEPLASEALGALSFLGEAAAPALIEGLKHPESRGHSAALLAHLDSKAAAAVPALLAALDDKNPEVRREVLFALGSVGPEAASGEKAILRELAEPNPHVQAGAAFALGRIGATAQNALPQLRKTLESTDPMLRVVSAWALAHIAPKDPQVARETIPVLVKGLQDDHTPVRRGAADALGLLGSPARVATESLRAATKDPDESVRHAATVALERIGGLITEPPAVPRKK